MEGVAIFPYTTKERHDDVLRRGRESYQRCAWADAYQTLRLADQASPLRGEDLERLAYSAYLTGRDDEFISVLDRAHHAHLESDSARAVRCAFWIGLSLLFRGEVGRATGWLSRARRLLEGQDCVEQGYLLLPDAEQRLREGDAARARATGRQATTIGERFGDPDLVAAARHLEGRALIQQGEIQAGLTLLDEAMLAVTAGELTPFITGLIYCSVIEACQQVYAFGRAREWTSELSRWCAERPQMVAFTTTCLVRRAEIMQLLGAWPDAMAEAQRACTRERPSPAAHYQQGEVHRLRGEFAAAEEAYRSASEGGWDPQPGLALLWLAQGRTDAADAAIRRVAQAATDRPARIRSLPAYIEIMLAAGKGEEARAACGELEAVAAGLGTSLVTALAAHARGAVALAEGDARSALASLRGAWQAWREVEAPYEAARVRVLIGAACEALGDHDSARLEWDAARAAFEELGAAPAVARLDALTRGASRGAAHGLTRRELQVLKLVAAGKTNRAVAITLSISEKTVARHVSNIFTKLGLSTRAAATAYAYKHRLV